jgi:putative Ca2+/H+ antiporter (TMEM165/GDT1 family)
MYAPVGSALNPAQIVADMMIGPVSSASDLQVFLRSLALVGVAELFDKTWFMGLLLALRYSPHIVFAGSFAALFLHCFFAAAFGLAFARLIPQSVLNFLAAGLFAVFALLYAKDWYQANPDGDAIAAGREEAEADCGLGPNGIASDDGGADKDGAAKHVIGKVAGGGPPKFFHHDADAEEDNFWKGDHVDQKDSEETEEVEELVPDPEAGNNDERSTNDTEDKAVIEEEAAPSTDFRVALSKSFVGVFIAEWGDRTQIAMIGQHASQPLIPVFMGSAIAFFFLTLSAVGLASVAGKLKLSERTVHGVGALSFGLFALLALKDSFEAIGVEDLHGSSMNATAITTTGNGSAALPQLSPAR